MKEVSALPYTLYITRQFEDDLKGFDPQHPVRRLLPRTCEYLEDDPRHHKSSLQNEPLKRLGKSAWSVWHSRVDQSYRIAWRYEDNSAILLLRVGSHDFIDSYATFNDADILRPWHEPAEPTDEARDDGDLAGPRQTPRAPRLFGNWSSVHLELLGVPSSETRDVKRITDIDQIYDLGLPDFAKQNLADVYALGDEWTTDCLFDSSRIFYRSNADQLAKYCRGEIKQLLLNLSPEQQNYVQMQTTGPTLIKGVAGSGKTTVGIYRAMRQTHARLLFEQDRDRQVLFVTYTETLARVVEQIFRELYGDEQAKRVEVWVLREWLRNYLDGRPGNRPVATRNELYTALWKAIYSVSERFSSSALSKHRPGRGRDRHDFFLTEIQDVIKGRDLRSWDEYARAERVGRRTALGSQPRRFVWAVYEEYERNLAEIGKRDYLDLALDGLRELQADATFRPYDAVVVDEAQDLQPVQLQVVSLLAGGASARDLVLLADPAQSIYYKGIPWKEGGVHIAPARSFSMKRNFRNTRQILGTAWSLAQHGPSDDPDEEPISPEASTRSGPRPQMLLCRNRDYHDRFVVETIKHLCGEMHYRPGDIAVLCRTRESTLRMTSVLNVADLPTVHFRDAGFDIFENNIKVVTINSGKGLEFPVVFVADLREGELPRNLSNDDERELEAEMRGERRLLYVGMTRAASRLYLVSYIEGASSFLGEIDADTVVVAHYEGQELAAGVS